MANKLDILREISIKIMSDIPLTPEEEEEWENWKQQDHIRQYLESKARDSWKRYREIGVKPWQEFSKRLGMESNGFAEQLPGIAWKKWMAAAAIILFGLFVGWYLLHNPKKQVPHPVMISEQAIRLILPDHQEIELNVPRSPANLDYGNFRLCLGDSGQICFRKTGKNIRDTGLFRVITPAGKTFKVLLSDSSTILLNNRTELIIPAQFDQQHRNIELKGEASFRVQANKSLPFIVRVRNTVQEVLGTEFLVSGYENDSLITTTLYTGGLSIRAGKNQLILKDSQQAVIDPVTFAIRSLRSPDLVNAGAWRNDYFSYRKSRILLTDLFRKIERWYDIRIIYDDNITNELLTIGRISRKDPVDSVLNLLKGPGAFDFVKKEDGFHIIYSRQP